MRLHSLFEREREAINIIDAIKNGYLFDGEMYRIETEQDLFHCIQVMGYNVDPLGDGKFSYVYRGSRNEVVMKLSRTPAAYSEDKWWDWAKLSKEPARKNPMFPKMYYINALKHEATGQPIGIAFLEYVHVNKDKLDDLALEMGFSKFSEIIEEVQRRANNRLAESYNNLQTYLKEFYIDIDDLISFIKNAQQFGFVDIHSGNVGYRKDGSFVIFDPVSIDV